MQEYAELRQPVHRQVVRNIAALTRVMRGRPTPLRWLRNTLMPELVKVAPLRRRLLQTMAGLDHPLRTRL
jgi:hypothetical protein